MHLIQYSMNQEAQHVNTALCSALNTSKMWLKIELQTRHEKSRTSAGNAADEGAVKS